MQWHAKFKNNTGKHDALTSFISKGLFCWNNGWQAQQEGLSLFFITFGSLCAHALVAGSCTWLVLLSIEIYEREIIWNIESLCILKASLFFFKKFFESYICTISNNLLTFNWIARKGARHVKWIYESSFFVHDLKISFFVLSLHIFKHVESEKKRKEKKM